MSWQPDIAMCPFATRRSIWRCCALSAIVLGLSLSAYQRAEAACGDYVLVRDALGRLVPASQLTGSHQFSREHGTRPVPAPCHGPSCSGRSNVPPATPPASFTSPAAPKALLALVAEPDDEAGSGRCRPPEGALHPIHHPGRIFRPPRKRAC